MPSKDIYHDVVCNALIKEGWTITHDPLFLRGKKDMYVDLGAERLIAAQKAKDAIAVEVKSFVGASGMVNLEKALGQYLIYRDVLQAQNSTRKLYLALPEVAQADIFDEPLGQLLTDKYSLSLIIFDIEKEVITQWIN